MRLVIITLFLFSVFINVSSTRPTENVDELGYAKIKTTLSSIAIDATGKETDIPFYVFEGQDRTDVLENLMEHCWPAQHANRIRCFRSIYDSNADYLASLPQEEGVGRMASILSTHPHPPRTRYHKGIGRTSRGSISL
jgi:hypothetical protein